jgi:hypothetical protein
MRTLAVALAVALAGVAPLVGCTVPAVELRELAAENACFADADCCVVVDSCAAEAYVVTADEFDTARDLADDTTVCADCIIPPVTVECVEGRCVGKAFNPADVRYAEGQAFDSCGPRAVETVVDEAAANDDLTFIALDDGVATCGTLPE